MRWIGFTLLVLLTSLSLSAQHISLTGKSLTDLKQLSQPTNKLVLFALPIFYFPTSIVPPSDPIKRKTTTAIPSVYAYKELAPFCKLEVKMEKVTKIPIKIRLGSVDYVDWLEGKRDNYY